MDTHPLPRTEAKSPAAVADSPERKPWEETAPDAEKAAQTEGPQNTT